jgi:hypothetical protein
VSHDAYRRLAVADRILRDPVLVEDGAWPRACTWLIRLAFEHSVDDFWKSHSPAIAAVRSRRAQLLTLSRTIDPDLGRRATELWHTLSRAAHHHAYELSPTGAELRSWHDEVRSLADDLNRAADQTSATVARTG